MPFATIFRVAGTLLGGAVGYLEGVTKAERKKKAVSLKEAVRKLIA
jgi:hypothetical protein